MSATPSHPDSGGTSDRVRCAYCGGNNFPTSPTCWQCGRPLRPLSVGAPAGATVGAPPAQGGNFSHAAPPPHWNTPRTDIGVNPGLAPKAAAALGLTMPWAGLPIGIVFLMLDDARKAKIGWIAIGWSVVGTILNLLLSLPLLLAIWALIKSHGAAPGGGLPSIPGVPNMPSMGGGGIVLMRLRAIFMF